MTAWKIIILTMFLGFGTPVGAEKATIAVASNFALPMKKLASMFEAKSRHEIAIVVGSSGKIYAQILHGAPFDLFFSADRDKPSRLVEQDLALKTSEYTYATGILVLWAPYLDIFAPNALANLDKKLAIANPKTAPYGIAALQALEKFNEPEQPKNIYIRAENVAQVYQFVKSRAVEQGLLALSQILNEPINSYLVIDPQLYEPIKQDVVMLNRAKNNQAAIDFLHFMKSKKVKDTIRILGYK
ncbi:MAG: molybdate ABC transporter substrate-binding protein [Hyphomicrobiales bacterium]